MLLNYVVVLFPIFNVVFKIKRGTFNNGFSKNDDLLIVMFSLTNM